VALGTGAFIGSAAAISIGAGATSGEQAMKHEQYQAALAAIAAARDAAWSRCEALAPAERDTCRIEVAGFTAVRAAEAEQAYRRTEGTARALQRVRIDARYQADRSRCGTLGGYKRDKCLIQAHANRGRALLDAGAPYESRS
jgi:hypothetical protein